MAKRRRKVANPRRRYAARRRNTAVRVVTRHRRRGTIHRGRRHNRRRNPMPSFFGGVGTKGLGMTIAGGLVGVAAAKLIPGLIPVTLTGTLGTWPRVGITAAAAWAAGTAAGKFIGRPFGDAVMFGGFMQTASMAITALLPNFKVGGVPLALSGMGELVAGSYPVPQNPIRAGQVRAAQLAAAASPARVNMNGLSRAFGPAF